jgi:hypothetical protein
MEDRGGGGFVAGAATVSRWLADGVYASNIQKVLANRQDVPYQSLMKLYLAERIGRERTRKAS